VETIKYKKELLRGTHGTQQLVARYYFAKLL